MAWEHFRECIRIETRTTPSVIIPYVKDVGAFQDLLHDLSKDILKAHAKDKIQNAINDIRQWRDDT